MLIDPSFRQRVFPMATNTLMVWPYILKKYDNVYHKGLDAMADWLAVRCKVTLLYASLAVVPHNDPPYSEGHENTLTWPYRLLILPQCSGYQNFCCCFRYHYNVFTFTLSLSKGRAGKDWEHSNNPFTSLWHEVSHLPSVISIFNPCFSFHIICTLFLQQVCYRKKLTWQSVKTLCVTRGTGDERNLYAASNMRSKEAAQCLPHLEKLRCRTTWRLQFRFRTNTRGSERGSQDLWSNCTAMMLARFPARESGSRAIAAQGRLWNSLA
jgi:hypothetical protein